jgi:hypothetical protein
MKDKSISKILEERMGVDEDKPLIFALTVN